MQIREKDAEIRNLVLQSKNTPVEISSPRHTQLQILTDRVEKAEKDYELKSKECRQREEDLQSAKSKNRLLKQTLLEKERLLTSLENEHKKLEEKQRQQESDSQYREKILNHQIANLSRSQEVHKQRASKYFLVILMLILVDILLFVF